MGIEPTSLAWEAKVLPLYYTRTFPLPLLSLYVVGYVHLAAVMCIKHTPLLENLPPSLRPIVFEEIENSFSTLIRVGCVHLAAACLA